MTNDWDMVMHLSEAAAMIIFGVGAWSAQRKAGETTNATDISKLATTVGDLKIDVATKMGWKDFDRAAEADRELTNLQIKTVTDRVDRLERKVFNGSARHGN